MHKIVPALFLACLAGCSSIAPPAVAPMPVIRQQLLGPERATGLLVLLPGKGDRGERFAQQGILEMVSELAPTFDVIAADAHFGYYQQRTLLTRLESDVIRPAIDDGYDQVWLLGISLGALGSLHYASQHPEQIDGVLLFGPYLGGEPLASELLKATDLASWNSEASTLKGATDPITYDAWKWLQSQTGPEAQSVVLLGYGSRDGPGTIAERLQAALPEEHFATTSGGHNWWTWIPLIRKLLPQMSVTAIGRQPEVGSK